MSVKGRIKDIALVDILQILHAEGKTVGVHLGSENGYGKVYLKNGNIVHANYRDHTGRQALTQLFEWKEGDFDVEPGDTPAMETIEGDFDAIIKECVKKEPGGENGRIEPKKQEDMESLTLINRLIENGIIEKTG
ncbi:MAG: DUF4388 domain-containing protein [Thermodesulfobacteriota bacterium]